MGDATKAVFLSYASQDAAAAKRIADALRAAGVEVWFDQSELVGGDAWDHKIRRQIKECALLIPIISAATQARTEGYFRLEWRLADQRTHLMAKGRPFLLPVVIDDTRDADAHVPDSFTEVQWTRLPAGETTPAFANRVAKLLSGDSPEAGRPRPAERGEGAASPRNAHRPVWLRYAWAAVGITLALFYGLRPMWQPERSKSKPAAKAEADAPVSAARKLANQARALIDDDPLAVRENYLTAKRLGERAIDLDPGDADAYAVTARASCQLIWEYQDQSPASIVAARSRAESAIRLAPDSVEAALALATVDIMTGSRLAEVEHSLETLLARVPNDRRVFHLLQFVAMRQGHFEESQQWVDRAIALPGGDPESLNFRLGIYWSQNNYPQMAATLEQSLAQRTTALACHYKLMLLVWGWGDLPAGRAWVEQMPASLLQEDRVAMLAYLTWYWSRQPDRALEVLQRFPRPFIEQGSLFVSTDYLAGCAQLLAGHAEAAKGAFAAGLKAVNDRLVPEPNNPKYLYEKVRLLARLGQKAEAEQVIRVLRELVGPKVSPFPNAELLILTGSNDGAMAAAERGIDRGKSRWPIMVNHLRYEPEFDSLRADPRFQAIVTTGEAQLAELRAGGGPAAALPAPSVDPKSVAVLAFANLSDDKGNEYFSDGISEELLTVLQKIPGLHVAARTSAFSFKGKEATAQEIGAKLGVANLVEGSVQKSGNRVKVTARLSRAATGEERWSESYTRELKDVFALQEELAVAILGELRGQLAGEESAATVKAAVKGGTKVPEAYQEHLQGKFFANRHSEKEMVQAQAHFQRAVELDPGFALAWAGLAQTHLWFCSFSTELGRVGFDNHLAKARVAVAQAMALEPEMAESLLAKSLIQLNVDFDWQAAGETLRKARAKAPADPALLLAAGNVAAAIGDNDETLACFRQAVAVDPVNPTARSYLALQLVTSGHYAEAEAEFPRVVALNSAVPWAHAGLALGYLLQHRYDDALAAVRDESAEYAQLLIIACARWSQQRRPESDAALDRLVAIGAGTAAYQIAEIHAYRGDLDRAFEWLARARKQRDSGLIELELDPLYASLHSDPRWAAFRKELGLPDDQLK